jgi:hypothetical protein
MTDRSSPESETLAARVEAHMNSLSDYDPSWGILIECAKALRTFEFAQTPAEPVQDTWFTDQHLPIMAASGDVENDRVLKLHFRHKVTDADRKRLIEVLNAGEAALSDTSTEGK